MTVISLAEAGRADVNDVPARMESMAALIRQGEYGNIVSGAAVFINENGEFSVCGWGRTDDIHSAGLLTYGAAFLAASRVKR